jgi:tetratricopeptide (TPR) repeat protein/transglutaminase-like putative cysteine protease
MPDRPRTRLALAAAVLALVAAPARGAGPSGGPAQGAGPWDGPALAADPQRLLAAADALAPPKGTAVDVLVEDAAYAFDARGALAVTHRIVYRPLTADAARAWARVERTWAPWHQARPVIRARVVTAKGEVHALDPATLSERGAAEDDEALYTDRRTLAGPLPGVRVGSIVEVETVLRDEAPAFDGGVTTRFYLAQPAPMRHVRLVVTAPAALPLRFVARGDGVTAVAAVKDGTRTITVDRRDVPALPPAEANAPRDVAAAPHLAFGWARSWADAAERYGAAWERQLRDADLAAELRAAVGGGARPDRAELVRRVVAWVHANVRYTGLELGEAAVVPVPPRETLKRRYGDCKDLSLLVVGLLRAAGLEARLALVRTAWEELTPELPGLSQFDHAVVRIEGTPPIWIDATDPYTPPGRLPPPVEGRLALVTGPGTKDLVRTPESAAGEHRVRTVREVHLPELGNGRIVETRELTGAFAAAERAGRERMPTDARDELNARYAKEVFGADEVVSATVEALDAPERPLVVRIEAAGAQAAHAEDDAAEVPVAPDAVLDGLPRALLGERGEGGRVKEPPPRKAPLFLAVPYEAEVVYRVVAPDGFRARPLPAASEERFGPARLTQAFALGADGAVTVTYRFATGGRRLAPADADALGKRARAIIAGKSPRIRFERVGAALLAAGKVPEALAEVRRLAALHPGEALHHLHLGLALLQLGFRDAAAAEARAAVALEPGRAWAHRVLGFVLEHDAVGRFHAPGLDHAGALAAYREARRLDPEHAGGRAVLAELLATGPDGERHGRGARLEDAIAEYASVKTDLDDATFGEPHLAALLAARRFADAEALARDLPRSAERDAGLLAAIAALRGAEAAEEEARGLGDGWRDALREAARQLVRVRRYGPAPVLASAAAAGAPNAAELRQQAEEFDGIRPWEELEREGKDAERLVRRVFVAALAPAVPGAREPAVARLLASARFPEDLRPVLLESVRAPVEGYRRALGAVSIDVFLDLTLSKLEVREDGDPRAVLRLRLRFPASAGERPPALFAVREGKELRILASDASWPLLGDEALRRLAAGDVETARRLIEWARDVVQGGGTDPGSPAAVLGALLPPGAPAGAAELRRAAATLLAYADPAARTVPILAPARAAAVDPAERRALGAALAQAYRGASRFGDLLAIADELLAADPLARDAFAAKALALQRLGRRAELDAAGDAILARIPADPDVVGTLGSVYTRLGDLDAAARMWRRAIDAGRAAPVVYNNAAWLELYRPEPAKETLEWARRATSGERDRDHASLNTLAMVLASLGRAGEARQVFVDSLDAAGGALGPSDWLVFGRIAEAWGLAVAARSAYARVAPEGDDPTSAEVLARRRLAALGPGVPPAPGAAPAAPVPASAPGAARAPGAAPPAKAPPRAPAPGKKPTRKPARPATPPRRVAPA